MKRKVYICGPTRVIGKNLEGLLKNENLPKTVLDIKYGDVIDAAIAKLPQEGIGIVAPPGSGKSVAILRMCRGIFPRGFKVGVINQENERTRYTDSCEVLVVTPGILMIMASKGIITRRDTIVLDEVHQTSVHLELAMAVLKLIGCSVSWASATVDPSVYQNYHGTRMVIECTAYSSKRRAKVTYQPHIDAQRYLNDHIPDIVRRQRGVAVFVATQAEAEKLSEKYRQSHGNTHGLFVSYYHGGADVENLDRFLNGPNPKPYLLFMTPAGASGLNIIGLNTVVIVDRMYGDVIRDGKVVTEQMPLSTSMLKQMLGRVEGRAVDGEAVVLTTNTGLDVRNLHPDTPNFLLGGDLEALALLSAKIGIDARKLSLIGNPDLTKYPEVLQRLVTRGLIIFKGGKPELTRLGERIERLSVGTAWGEVVVQAQHDHVEGTEFVADGHENLFQTACLTASIERLYAVTRKEWKKDNDELVIRGSDHLTGYNIVAAAIRKFGRTAGKNRYRIGGDSFSRWCSTHGYSPRGISTAVQLYVALAHQLKIGLPEPAAFAIVREGDRLHVSFVCLLAKVQSMDYVPQTAVGIASPYVNKNGVTNGSSVLGTFRYWTYKGVRYSAIEGTQIPAALVKKYSKENPVEITEMIGSGRAIVRHQLSFAGYPLAGAASRMVALDDLPPELVAAAA